MMPWLLILPVESLDFTWNEIKIISDHIPGLRGRTVNRRAFVVSTRYPRKLLTKPYDIVVRARGCSNRS